MTECDECKKWGDYCEKLLDGIEGILGTAKFDDIVNLIKVFRQRESMLRQEIAELKK